MKKYWRIMQLAIAACFLALTGYVSSPVEAQEDTCPVPAPRGYLRMIHDAVSGKVYLFGGYSTISFDPMDVLDVWAFDTEEKTWQLVGQQESNDYDGLAFDTQSRKVILYNTFVLTADGGCCGIETWAYDPDSNTWQNMETPNPPPLRFGSRMVYDAESDRVVLFGGADVFTFQMLSDTWTYDYESDTWTNMEPANSPPPHFFHDMVYHQAGDRIVMFGGYDEGSGLYRNDTWAYDTNTNNWTELHPATPPSPRSYAPMAYEAQTGEIVMFGGTLDATLWPNEPVSEETWIFDLEAASWTQASPKKPSPARAWYHMVGVGNGVVAFGGGPSRFAYNSDTYTYSSRKNLWKRVNPCEDGGD